MKKDILCARCFEAGSGSQWGCAACCQILIDARTEEIRLETRAGLWHLLRLTLLGAAALWILDLMGPL